MTGHPLRPVTDHRPGRPLPHQLTNRTQAPPIANVFQHPFLLRVYAVLARVSPGCPPLQGRFLRVTHPSATRHQNVLLHSMLPFDLHVLGMPPAFNLSQDQTLQFLSKIKKLYPTQSSCFSKLLLKVTLDRSSSLFRNFSSI